MTETSRRLCGEAAANNAQPGSQMQNGPLSSEGAVLHPGADSAAKPQP